MVMVPATEVERETIITMGSRFAGNTIRETKPFDLNELRP